MGFLTIQTPGGPLGLVGRLHEDRPRPVLLAIGGAFPPQEHLHDLIKAFTGANVLVVHLPGMGGAYWAENPDLGGLTAGLDRALKRLVGNLPVVVLGASTGNLLSLGLKSPNICWRVAIEPFFQTEPLWPFIVNSRERLRQLPDFPQLATFLWTVFGISKDGLENRDYRYLAAGVTTPTDVMVGQIPLLPQRKLDVWPSFTSDEDRALLAANPLVRWHEGPPGSGHDFGSIPPGDQLLGRLLHSALREASALCLG